MTAEYVNAYLSIGVNDRKPRRIGGEFSRVFFYTGQRYLDRFIAYCAGGTVRLHRFWRGDDDRAPHDHPWWFVTFPFASYIERYWERVEFVSYDIFADCEYTQVAWTERTRVVKAWRFHFRPARFRHIVVRREDGKDKPFWTLVITGMSKNKWGFYPDPETYVYWRDWK